MDYMPCPILGYPGLRKTLSDPRYIDGNFVFVMPPTSNKLTGHTGFGLSERACVRACVRVSVCSSRTVHARVLKFHIWIPHGKIVFLSELSPFLDLCPFEKNQNEI